MARLELERVELLLDLLEVLCSPLLWFRFLAFSFVELSNQSVPSGRKIRIGPGAQRVSAQPRAVKRVAGRRRW